MRDEIVEEINTLIPNDYLYPTIYVAGGNMEKYFEDERMTPYYVLGYPFSIEELKAGEIGIVNNLRIVFI